MHPVRRQINRHAITLRRDATEAERQLWSALRNRQLDGVKFRRQVTLGPYIVDFLCVDAALVVEVDGGQHSEEVDASRSAWLTAQGYQILRFWNHEVLTNLDGVVEAIAVDLKKKTLTQPSPAKAGEG
jgi:very-short-patch-repair endonuclease